MAGGDRRRLLHGRLRGAVLRPTYPDRTDRLALIDTTAWCGPGAQVAWQARAATAQRGGMAALPGFQAERWFSPGFSAGAPDVLARWLAVLSANDVACYAAACVMVGAEDEATPPAMVRALAAGMAGAALSVVPAARHLTPIERPEAVAQAIADFLHL